MSTVPTLDIIGDVGMKDQTIVELAGMALLGVLALGAMIVDGDIGESVMVGVSAGLGAIVTHVYHTGKGGDSDEEEVQESGSGA